MQDTEPDLAPSVASNQLRSYLRRTRESRKTDDGQKMTQPDVADSMNWSISKVMRIESGESKIQDKDLRALLKLYEIDDAQEIQRLLALARASRKPSLAQIYRRAASRPLAEVVEHEGYAVAIKQYESKYIPGILQLPGYSRPLLRALTDKSEDDDILGMKVDLRLLRARDLLGPQGPILHFILDESALRRAVGGEKKGFDSRDYRPMIQMLEALKTYNTVGRAAAGERISPTENPRITVQIVPFSVGMYKSLRGAFEMLEFEANTLTNMVYYEDRDHTHIVRGDDTREYVDRFADLQTRCPHPRLTNQIVDRVIELMRSESNSGFEGVFD